MKKIIVSFLLLGLAACDQRTVDSQSDELKPAANTTEPATDIHQQVLTIDSHIDISFEFATEQDPLSADIQANLEKMIAGGLDSGFYIVYVGQSERTAENYANAQTAALVKFLAIRRMAFELYPDKISLALSPTDVQQAVATGKLAAVIGIENGFVIGKELESIDYYHQLGARYITLVHNGHNDIGDSAQPREQFGDGDSEHNGLSEFGIAAIKRMNEVGIMVDISHASKPTALQAIAASQAPVIASHSSVSGVYEHPRNLDDETLAALKANGGVVHIVAYSAYLKATAPEYAEARRALNSLYGFEGRPDLNTLDEKTRAEYLREVNVLDQQYPGASVQDLVDHIDYAVQQIGIDHVGISSDFGGGGGIDGWRDATETPNVTAELINRGYSQADISKLWSGNLLRVWQETETIAASLSNKSVE